MKLIVVVALVVMTFAAPNDKKNKANKKFNIGHGGGFGNRPVGGFGNRPGGGFGNRPGGGFGNRPGGGFGNRPGGGFGQGHGHGGGGGFGGGLHQGGGFGHVGSTSKCRYWCKDPHGRAYCCEGNTQPAGNVGVKPGTCPPVRPVCPQNVRFGPPQTCSNDYKCNGSDKCCFDTCLEQHVCKQPIRGFGRK